jgi:3-deoxy-D-manno-octulosonic-acid transferase
LYNTLLILSYPALAVYLGQRLATGKSREGWDERWGRLSPSLAKTKPVRVWVHAASVGEVMAASPILKAYRALHPEHEIVLSVITPGGHEVATGLVGSLVDKVFYCPFDLAGPVKRVVKTIKPDLFINLETELWPNLLYHVHRSGAKMVLVNARISDRSFGSYRRLKPIFSWSLSHFDRILAQTPLDAERFQILGAKPERVSVFGNAKFDEAPERLSADKIASLRHDLHIPEGAPVFVVGSTRQPEEERQVIEAYQIARKTLPNLVLIHAPRHIERAEELAGIMKVSGLNPVRRTQLSATTEPVQQLILDTFGELGGVYALADVTFIGNSLTAPGGGQNLLQPLAHGKPVLYGKYMQNFRDLVFLAKEAGVGFTVTNAEDIARHILELIQNKEKRADISVRAVSLIESNLGAAAHYAQAIADLLPVSL